LGTAAQTYLAVNGSTVHGVYCVATSNTAITCTFNSDSTNLTLGSVGYGYDYLITPTSGAVAFNLYTTVGGSAATSLKASVTSTLTPAGFTWDDTSTNGGTGSTYATLNGLLISNFPTNSYTISQ